MTVLKDVFNFITKAHNMERPPAVGTGITTLGGFGASGSNKVQEMTTYSTVSWVFAAVSRIAEAVSSSEVETLPGPRNGQRGHHTPRFDPLEFSQPV